MLQKAISGTMSKAHLNGFNKMVNHKLDYFYLQGKVSLSLAFIHGIATTWYLFSADKKAFVNNNGVSDSKRGVIRSVKSILTSRCPVDCSLNAGILSTAGFLLEQKMGSLFMIKCVSLLFVSTIVAINVKSLIKSTQNIITDN